MSVKIKVDGLAEREVMNLHYALHQEVDVEGRPTAVSRGGRISVTVKSLNDGNKELFEWACDPYIAKKGKIEFEKRDGTNMKTLEFEDGYMVEYEELYNAVDADSQMEVFTISAKKITIGGVSHENTWAEK
jgi:hypothetical protein